MTELPDSVHFFYGGAMTANTNYPDKYPTLLEVGRPPNIKHLFPNSKAAIVSGKFIDRAMRAKGGAMTIAANARNHFVLLGALLAAQKANAAIIIEIARSEGGTAAYCPVSLWNIARHVDAMCNQYRITVPVAVHADHFGIKKQEDLVQAKTEIVSLFDAGITSIAIDASHMPDDQNLLANIELNPFVPDWAGLETEVGEIKGKLGLSTPDEALFLIQGLNANGIFPDWIALNNGTTHGIEASGTGIDVDLTRKIHDTLSAYRISGAQHGTSGNDSDRLRAIASQTTTTKANVATALQMISWGLEVNAYGNAFLDDNGNFVKIKGRGVTEPMWEQMLAYAGERGIRGGDFKKLNLPFENRLLAQPADVRKRMADHVAEFVYDLLVNVFNAKDTASLVFDDILETGSHNPGPKVGRIENPEDWTPARIAEKAALIDSDKGPEGNFDD